MLLTALLTLLGYESCTEAGADEYGVVPLYGSLSATYHISGTVTDEGGQPLKGIRVSMVNIYDPSHTVQDSSTTDASGKFSLKEYEFYGDNDRILIAEDIDGLDNGGQFAPDTTFVGNLKPEQTEAGSNFYAGKFELKADVKLKKKE